jgi:hypothetical protein
MFSKKLLNFFILFACLKFLNSIVPFVAPYVPLVIPYDVVTGQWVTVQRKLLDWATCVNVRTVWPPLMISNGRSQSLWCEG